MNRVLLVVLCLASVPAYAVRKGVTVDRYDDSAFVALVAKHAPEGRVDYAAWKANAADVAALEAFIKQISSASPQNRPELFPTPAEKTAYWCTAYNAWTVWSVLELWPIKSVMDVKSGVLSYFKPGAGFFYGRTIVLGGRETNLYDLENKVIRKLGDPRIHFAINCASNSCPTLQAAHWTQEELESATRAFVNNPQQVRVTSEGVSVNPILDWYKEDFGNVPEFLLRYANEGPLREQLLKVKAGKARLNYFEYDWGVNARLRGPSGP